MEITTYIYVLPATHDHLLYDISNSTFKLNVYCDAYNIK